MFEFIRHNYRQRKQRSSLRLDACRLAILSWLLALLPLSGASAAANTILVLGDSLSAGYGVQVEQGWVALLKQRLTQQGYGYQVVNASVSGETSGGGKVRLPALLKAHQPGLVIVELGANDGLRGLPLQQLHSNLDNMITGIQASGAQVLLVGMQMPPNYGATYVNGFAHTFGDVAQLHKAKLVPFLLDGVALDASLMQNDNLHPNERGQPKLLDNVWAVLQPMLKK